MYPFTSRQPTLKLEGVRQYFQGDGQDKQRAYQYFHDERSPQIGDSLVAVYEKWGQDLTVQGQLTNCFLRFQGDALEDESVCKLAAIALHPGSIAYDHLIHAFYQKLKNKEDISKDLPGMYRLSPREVEEIWRELQISPPNSYNAISRPSTRQLPSSHNTSYLSSDTILSQSIAGQNSGLGQTMTDGNNRFPSFVQQVRPSTTVSSQIYQSGLERAAQMNVEAASIWSDLSHKIDKKWETIENNINTAHNQFRNDLIEDLKSSKPLLRQEIMQECQQEIERRVDEMVQNERQLKLKRETKEMLKHELKTDLIDQINQAVKREMLAGIQKELEASFKDELFQTLKGSIGQDVISLLLNRNDNSKVSAPTKQIQPEVDCSSKLQEVTLQNKRVAPQADMGRHQFIKKVKVEADEKTTQSFQHISPTHKSGKRPSKDEKTWAIVRFESKNTIHETPYINLILNTVSKTLNLRIVDGNSLVIIKLTYLLEDARICYSTTWLNIDTRNHADSIWLRFSNTASDPVLSFAEQIRNAGLSRPSEKSVASVKSCYSEWTKFLNSRSSSYPGAYLQRTWSIQSLHTGIESFIGKGIKLTLNLCSKLLLIGVNRLTYRLDTPMESAITCRFSSKWVCLDLSKSVRHTIWIEIDGNPKSLIKEIEGVAKIKAEEALTPIMDEQFKAWHKENMV